MSLVMELKDFKSICHVGCIYKFGRVIYECLYFSSDTFRVHDAPSKTTRDDYVLNGVSTWPVAFSPAT